MRNAFSSSHLSKGKRVVKHVTPRVSRPLTTSPILALFTTLLFTTLLLTGCVVKEELNDTYNQAHLGLNEWSLLNTETETGAYELKLDIGYLIGLVDDEGIDAIEWTYELMTTDQEVLASNSEEMRAPSLEKRQVFVEGKRKRELAVPVPLSEGVTYVLWFTLYYEDEILHEQLFPIIAGEEGGDPGWLAELIGERLGDDLEPSDLNGSMNQSDESPSEVGAGVGPLPEMTDE